MRRLRLAPKDVETIVLSHGHWDHVAGMEGISKELGGRFPDAFVQSAVGTTVPL
jgi:metal-dependent hydrolase (beta-lactamase superfamily II)